MRKFTKLMLTLALLVVGVGGAKATEKQLNFTFEAPFYAAASWNGGTRMFSWGSGGWNTEWTFININNVSGDLSKYTKLYFKLENWTNSAEEKLTLYFKEKKGDTQSMDYVAKVEIEPNVEGEFEFDLTTFDWKNNANPSETIDKTNIYDVTLYGGARTGEGDGSVKITEAYLSYQVNSVSIENPANLVEIAQEQDQEEDGTIHKAAVSGPTDGVTTYTTTDGICIIVKTLDVNVADCDYITYKFAEPIPAGISYAVWSKSGNRADPLGTGITEFKYVFADDPTCAIAGNVIPQVSLVTVFAQAGKVVKVKGIYKHKTSETDYNRTYSFDQALDFTGTGLEAYVITAFNPVTATLTLSRVYKVPANTGLYLVGKDGDYEIPVIDSADPIATNLLHASSGSVALEPTESTNTNLIFGGTGENRGFHPLSASGVIGANKAYLQLPTADLPTSARLSFVFEDEITAIKTLNEVKAIDNAWYTVNGVKLNAKPTQKGIYINNGKKYAVK